VRDTLVRDNLVDWYFLFYHILHDFVLTPYVMVFVTGTLVVRGRLRTPMPCMCDLAIGVLEYHEEGMRLSTPETYSLMFYRWMQQHEDMHKNDSSMPDSCDAMSLGVIIMMSYLYAVGIKKLIVFVAEIMDENFTVKVLEFEPVVVYNTKKFFFSLRVREDSKKTKTPTIRLDKSCELQVLRIECTTIKQMKKKTDEQKETQNEIGGNVGVGLNNTGVNPNFEYIHKTSRTVQSTFKHEVVKSYASVGCPWQYKNVPEGGIEVKVRLEEDDQVIARAYFYDNGTDIDGNYEFKFSYSDNRRLKSTLAQSIIKMIVGFWTSTEELVRKNREMLFHIFYVVAAVFMVGNVLVPLVSSQIISIADSLKDTWRSIF